MTPIDCEETDISPISNAFHNNGGSIKSDVDISYGIRNLIPMAMDSSLSEITAVNQQIVDGVNTAEDIKIIEICNDDKKNNMLEASRQTSKLQIGLSKLKSIVRRPKKHRKREIDFRKTVLMKEWLKEKIKSNNQCNAQPMLSIALLENHILSRQMEG